MAWLHPTTRDLVRTPGGDWQRAENPTLAAMVNRLLTWRGTCFWDLEFGSTLHLLPASKIGATVARDVEDRVRSALRPMTLSGEITNLDVQVRRVERHRVEMVARALDAGRRPLTFSTFVAV